MPPIDPGLIADYIQNQYRDDIYPHAPQVPHIFAQGLIPNPRKVKRALNTYQILLELSRIRVRNWEMNPVDLELLAKIVVIQSRFPHFYNHLEDNPKFLYILEYLTISTVGCDKKHNIRQTPGMRTQDVQNDKNQICNKQQTEDF